jgi:tRNA pseudouridine13 synthase
MEEKSSAHDAQEDLPRAVGQPPLMYATLKREASDFVVDEEPAYAPEGVGDHLYIRFEKTGLDTDEAVRRIARALGVDAREAGVAGKKDRHAVTTQWASFLRGDPDQAKVLELPQIRVLEVSRHKNKIRTGHLRGNRFALRLRDLPSDVDLPAIQSALGHLTEKGLPAYYGEQRFGIDNLARARGWLVDGGHAPRHPGERKFLVSVLQSSIFNELCAARLRMAHGLATIVHGDVAKKDDTGGLFLAEDTAEVQARALRFEVSATGPMFGASMRSAEHESKALEEEALARHGLDADKLARFSKFGEGTRRVYRFRVRGYEGGESAPEARLEDGDLILRFSLPAGAYATTLVRELVKEPITAPPPRAAERDGPAVATDPLDAP